MAIELKLRLKLSNANPRKRKQSRNFRIILSFLVLFTLVLCQKTNDKESGKSQIDIKDLILFTNVDYRLDYLFSVGEMAKNQILELTFRKPNKEGEEMVENIYLVNGGVKLTLGGESKLGKIFSVQIFDSKKMYFKLKQLSQITFQGYNIDDKNVTLYFTLRTKEKEIIFSITTKDNETKVKITQYDNW
jgi:hypothetical protein